MPASQALVDPGELGWGRSEKSPNFLNVLQLPIMSQRLRKPFLPFQGRNYREDYREDLLTAPPGDVKKPATCSD
jgi:hypothetical protein